MSKLRLRIPELAKEHGLTQAKIAKHLNIPESTMSRWAGNKIDRLDKNILVKLKHLFNCTWDELLEEVEE